MAQLWIPSYVETGRHPKTRKLARLLKASVPATIGHLHLFWHWCMEFAGDGDVTNHDAIDIADAAMWEGDCKDFLNALELTGFLDRDGESLWVHDWDEYGGKMDENRKVQAERQKRYRERQKAKMKAAEDSSTVQNEQENNEIDESQEEENNVIITLSSRDDNVMPYNKNKNKKYSTPPDGGVRAQAREAPPPQNDSPPLPSRKLKYLKLTPEHEAMLDAVLAILGKSIDFDAGNFSDRDERTVAKILGKIKCDGRTLEDLQTYQRKFVEYLGRDPATVNPPTPDQMLANFDMILNFKRGEKHGSTTGNNQPQRGLGSISKFAPGATTRAQRIAAQQAAKN